MQDGLNLSNAKELEFSILSGSRKYYSSNIRAISKRVNNVNEMEYMMNFNKSVIAIIVSVSGFMASTAHANNVITFNGEVVDTTCEPVVTDGNYTVVLDQVAKSSLTAVGQYAAVSAPFSIQVKNCPSTVTAVGAVLASSTYDAGTGNLTDVSGYGSSSVQIQVMDGTTPASQVVVGAETPVTWVPTSSNAASIPMTAFYYVNDVANVEVGEISTTATYALRTQ